MATQNASYSYNDVREPMLSNVDRFESILDILICPTLPRPAWCDDDISPRIITNQWQKIETCIHYSYRLVKK